MKYKIYIWIATLLIVTCIAAAAEESSSALTVQNNVSPLVYTEGCIPSGIGGFEIGMVDGAKVQQIALIGAGTNARLSWSAYMQDGGFVIDLQLDAVVAPGTEEYTLSLLIDGVSYAEPFAITVVEGAPPQEGLGGGCAFGDGHWPAPLCAARGSVFKRALCCRRARAANSLWRGRALRRPVRRNTRLYPRARRNGRFPSRVGIMPSRRLPVPSL